VAAEMFQINLLGQTFLLRFTQNIEKK